MNFLQITFTHKKSSSCSTCAEKKQVGMLLELHAGMESDPAAGCRVLLAGSRCWAEGELLGEWAACSW